MIPAALQSAAYLPVHSCAVGTNLSLTIVSFMFAGVTHSGVSSDDGTDACVVVSVGRAVQQP